MLLGHVVQVSSCTHRASCLIVSTFGVCQPRFSNQRLIATWVRQSYAGRDQ